ncbi:hypothetical protein F4806DRAFT_48734 [Annulohypoxylon nitens]|nr:hypothetical protein F4806DRAFT_48734 [Annulohypoxylon nitens]
METISVEDLSSQASSSHHSSTARWRQGVVPGTPASSVTSPEDHDNSSQYSTESIAVNAIGSAEYAINLRRNRIFRDQEMWPRPPIPQFVIELGDRIKQPRNYPNGRKYADRKVRFAMSSIFYREDSDNTFGSYWSHYLPLNGIVYTEIYLETTGLNIEDAGFLYGGKHCNKIAGDSVLDGRLSKFPLPTDLDCSGADITMGYDGPWLSRLFHRYFPGFPVTDKYRHFESILTEYQLRPECLLFPYLVVEHTTGLKGTYVPALHRLQTVCAVYLSSTKELIRTNNIIFGLMITDCEAMLIVMCMEGTLENTIFIMHTLDVFHLKMPEHITQLQDALMHIHDWGLQERRVEVEREILEHISAQENGTTRPRPSFESDYTYGIDSMAS